MRKVKRLKLWSLLYRTSLPERDVRNITPMDFCSTECTSSADVQARAGSGWISWERRNVEGFVIPPFPNYTLRAFILHTYVVGGSHWMAGIRNFRHHNIQLDMKKPTGTFWCLLSCMEQSSWEAISCSAYLEILLLWYNLKVHLRIYNCSTY